MQATSAGSIVPSAATFAIACWLPPSPPSSSPPAVAAAGSGAGDGAQTSSVHCQVLSPLATQPNEVSIAAPAAAVCATRPRSDSSTGCSPQSATTISSRRARTLSLSNGVGSPPVSVGVGSPPTLPVGGGEAVLPPHAATAAARSSAAQQLESRLMEPTIPTPARLVAPARRVRVPSRDGSRAASGPARRLPVAGRRRDRSAGDRRRDADVRRDRRAVRRAVQRSAVRAPVRRPGHAGSVAPARRRGRLRAAQRLHRRGVHPRELRPRGRRLPRPAAAVGCAAVLTEAQIEQFVADGYVAIEAAFPRALADAGRAILWRDTGCDPDDPATWTRPVIRLGLYGQEPFAKAATMPVLHRAFDQLIGEGRWLSRPNLGTFPVRFPSPDDPGDAGWHIDVSFRCDADDPNDFLAWRANIVSE